MDDPYNNLYVFEYPSYKHLVNIAKRLADETYPLAVDERRDLANLLTLIVQDRVVIDRGER